MSKIGFIFLSNKQLPINKSKPQSNDLKFLIIARLLKEKGIINFLEAAQKLKKIYIMIFDL